MYFLYPAFLFAMLSLAIPVIVHLFNFRKYKKVYFSNVQFLKEVKEQQASHRNLKERLILAARLLALAFLVLAFARPYIPGRQKMNAGKQQVISVFVDNSYSMQNLSREGSLLDEAKSKAKEIATAYGINDRYQLLTHDFEGKHQRLLNRDEFNDAVDAIKISPQSRTLKEVISRQESLLETEPSSLKSIFIISDFQKNKNEKPVKADSDISVNLVQLKAGNLPNVAVDSAWLLSAVHQPGQSEKLVIKLHNYAAERAEKIPLKVLINGTQKAIGSFSIDARSAQEDTLSFSGLQAGWQKGEIQLQDNPVTFDNRFYFSFNVNRQMPVLLIDGGTPNPYLKAVFGSDNFFAVRRVADGGVDYAALNSYPVVFISDVKAIATGLAQQLKTYVARGGSLVVFPAADADLVNYRSFLQSLNAGFPEKLVTRDVRVSEINRQTQIFKNVFESFPPNPDLPVVKKYYQLGKGTGAAENLMSLATAEPFWASYQNGKSKVYVVSVPLNEDFSNLPRHALFVPVLFRIALLSGHEQPLFYTLGADEPLEIAPVHTTEKQLLKLTRDSLSIIPDVRQQEGGTTLYISDQLRETGIYALKKQDSTLAMLAFNDNRAESDMSYFTPADLQKLLPDAKPLLTAGNGRLKSVIAESNFGTQLWKLCIILALIFLLAEILLIRFYKPENQATTQAG
ncbi:putative membrane protein (TIGR02226 family) [Mucilaginibacter oryzae]|uniref:Putative membrane protein (TIGR02226 family) n=1 Tax=Mucilaginibacter oryzae TaxID=468058 RepID=A0A316HDU3_9SPHI|nr:BatA domain-containing protein [Mucilaginibacter oryzae]PWK79344.1 putative membrane protein (TIGR02226 family) [Mucilaginibacter oryzae]